jgi:hypothetical protein
MEEYASMKIMVGFRKGFDLGVAFLRKLASPARHSQFRIPTHKALLDLAEQEPHSVARPHIHPEAHPDNEAD